MPTPTAPLVFFMGQSNAIYESANPAGASSMNGSDVLSFNGTDWGTAQAQLNGFTDKAIYGVGPNAMRFTRQLMVKLGLAGPAGIINRGKASTEIALHVPGQALYDDALADWAETGLVPGYAVFVEGEQDSVLGTSQSAFDSALRSIINGWRAAWGGGLKVAIVLVPFMSCYGIDNSQIRAAQRAVAAALNCALVDVDRYAVYPTVHPEWYDGCHWTEPGYELLAATTANAILGVDMTTHETRISGPVTFDEATTAPRLAQRAQTQDLAPSDMVLAPQPAYSGASGENRTSAACVVDIAAPAGVSTTENYLTIKRANSTRLQLGYIADALQTGSPASLIQAPSGQDLQISTAGIGRMLIGTQTGGGQPIYLQCNQANVFDPVSAIGVVVTPGAAASVKFSATCTTPTISQLQAAAGAGITFPIRAQAAAAASGLGGGTLLLAGGAADGAGAQGGVSLQDGTQVIMDVAVTTPGVVTLAANKSLAGAAGTGALSLGSMTGATMLPTGDFTWTGATNKLLTLTASGTGTFNLETATGDINVGNSAAASRTCRFGTGATISTCTLGAQSSSSTTNVWAGGGGVSIVSSFGAGVAINANGGGDAYLDGTNANVGPTTATGVALGNVTNTATWAAHLKAAGTANLFVGNAAHTINLGTGSVAQIANLFNHATAANEVNLLGAASKLGCFGGTAVVKQAITGSLSTIVDVNAKAVITSIIAALAAATGYNLVTDSTT